MTVHIMVSCLMQVEWEVDWGESRGKHFAECVYMYAVGVLAFQALEAQVLFVPKQAASWTVMPDHLNTWNSHHRPTGVFILFTLFCISAFVRCASGPYIWVGIQA